MKNDSTDIFAANPLVLFCKDSKQESFSGANLAGFDFKFCNQTRITQTDVGMCVASNPQHYLESGQILQSNRVIHNNQSLKDNEHLMIINVDKYGKGSDFKVSTALNDT